MCLIMNYLDIPCILHKEGLFDIFATSLLMMLWYFLLPSQRVFPEYPFV